LPEVAHHRRHELLVGGGSRRNCVGGEIAFGQFERGNVLQVNGGLRLRFGQMLPLFGAFYLSRSAEFEKERRGGIFTTLLREAGEDLLVSVVKLIGD